MLSRIKMDLGDTQKARGSLRAIAVAAANNTLSPMIPHDIEKVVDA